MIRVSDTGIGIPASDQKELFNRFFRASNATGRSIPGTGLGLAIVRMIVVNHGGDIDLRVHRGRRDHGDRLAPAAAPGRSPGTAARDGYRLGALSRPPRGRRRRRATGRGGRRGGAGLAELAAAG